MAHFVECMHSFGTTSLSISIRYMAAFMRKRAPIKALKAFKLILCKAPPNEYEYVRTHSICTCFFSQYFLSFSLSFSFFCLTSYSKQATSPLPPPCMHACIVHFLGEREKKSQRQQHQQQHDWANIYSRERESTFLACWCINDLASWQFSAHPTS